MRFYIKQTVPIIGWLSMWMQFASGLLCNLCYNADKVVDCMRATQQCAPDETCFRDSMVITYDGANDVEHTVWMYKMGCTFTAICRDGVSYGPGPYGYSRIIRFCCCTDRCNEPDSSGKGHYQNCSPGVINSSINGANTPYTSWTQNLVLVLIPSLIIMLVYTISFNMDR